MAAGLLREQVDIDSPAAKTRYAVIDFGRMPRRSPQCRLMTATGSLRQNTRPTTLSRRHSSSGPTTSIVTEIIVEKMLTFRDIADKAIRRYESNTTANRTRLADRRHTDNGPKTVTGH